MQITEVNIQPIIAYAATRPLDVLPESLQATRKGVTIASVYPGTLRKQLRHNGTTEYVLEGPPRGTHSQLTVYDTQQWIRFASEQGPRYDQMAPGPIPAMVVAQDLVQTWAGAILKPKNAQSTIGVGIIRGETPSTEELTILHAGQNSMFNLFIQEANSLHIAGKGIDITDIHRTAAKYLLDQGAENLPWFPKIDFAEVKTCIACRKKIYAEAIRCEHCNTFLPQLYMDWGMYCDDKAVSDFLAKAKPPKPKSTQEIK